MTVLPRSRKEELLDADRLCAGGLSTEELSTSLGQVAAVDRWLGGERALRRHLEPLVTGRPSGRILDVGTGDGTVLRRTVAWARRTGGPGWRGVGVDLHPDVIRVATRRRERRAGASGPPASRLRRDPDLVRADAGLLPFPSGAFDVVVATLTLHHFPEDEAAEVLREMARVSRQVVLVSDLERSRLHYLGARLLAATWWRRNRFTRHDGPLSVLRSFTADEMARLAGVAGLRRVSVRRHFPFRLVLRGHPAEGGSS